VAPAVSRLVGLLAMVWMVVMVREYGSDACSSLCRCCYACVRVRASFYISRNPRYAVVNDSLSYVLTLYRTRTRTRGRGRSRRRRERERERDTTRMDLIDGRGRRTTKSTNDSHRVLERVVEKDSLRVLTSSRETTCSSTRTSGGNLLCVSCCSCRCVKWSFVVWLLPLSHTHTQPTKR